ncbi:MAG: methanogenesis marker 17 protein [Methanomicrobiales archaeon]|nr:methanogenesis marker 17 protein [Methanomicrobiales archaeon]
MEALDYFQVESPEAAGAEYYKQIMADVLQDLDLVKIISRLHIFVDPKVPVFVAVGTIRKLPGMVRVRDCGNVKVEEGRAVISIGDEKYLSSLLKVLSDTYGKQRIDQPDRFTVIVTGEGIDGRELEEIQVADPSEGIYRDIIYAMQYGSPEGFKVRRQGVSRERFYYVASEDTLPEDVVETLVKEKFSLMGVPL